MEPPLGFFVGAGRALYHKSALCGMGRTCTWQDLLGRQSGDINSSKGPLSTDCVLGSVLGAIHIVTLCSSSSSR